MHCDNVELREGEECPKCGSYTVLFGMIDTQALVRAKSEYKKAGYTHTWHCPNYQCTNRERLQPNTPCPKCGAMSQELEVLDIAPLLRRKKLYPLIKSKRAAILISGEMTDEEIVSKIFEDMSNLAMHEAGTGWMRLGTLLSGSSTDQMLGAGFKALIDQNKIIIRQNELILRALQRMK